MNRAVVFLLLPWLVGCSHEESIEWQQMRRTVLVYLAGDNSLSSEVVAKRTALVRAWRSEIEGRLLIFTDRKGSAPVLEQVSERNGLPVADTLRVYANGNSASGDLLREVIADMRLLAPAHSYGLWLFSHGTGWLPSGFFENPYGTAESETMQVYPEAYCRSDVATRSFARDGDCEMEIADLKAALPDGFFDFIVFEACFMGNAETMYALRNKAPYMLVSPTEIISPGFALLYDKVLPKLYEEKADLQSVAELFYRYFDVQEGAYRGAAITLVNTSGMASLADVCRPILQRMVYENATDSTNLPFALVRLSSPDSLHPLDRLNKHLFFDFRHSFSLIADPYEMKAIDAALKQVVACYCHTPKMISVSLENTSGLSVYVEQPDLKNLNNLYRKTEWWIDLVGR
jgi:hypothetical protein